MRFIDKQILLWLLYLLNCACASERSAEEVRKLLTKTDTKKWLQSMEVRNNSSPYCKLCCVNITSYTIGKSCGSHTLCKYPAGRIGPSCKGYVNVKFAPEEKAAILDIHNSLRNKVALGMEQRGNPGPQPSASNMRLLMWNDELADIAERWSAQCIYAHDRCRDTVMFPVGQNLARGNLATNSEMSLVVDWYDEVVIFNKKEVSSYIIPTTGTHPARHYSQLVWADSNQIGCARAIFQQTKGANISYKEHLICNYGPSGNIPNQPVYKSGKPCVSCPDGTTCSIDYEGLCEIERKFGRVQRLSMRSESYAERNKFVLFIIQFCNVYLCLYLLQ